jgi:hypothetical protein
MVVFIEVVDGAEVEPRAVLAINRVGGLMKYFPPTESLSVTFRCSNKPENQKFLSPAPPRLIQ